MSEAIARELSAARRRLEALETLERGRFAARVYNSADISIATSGLPQALTFDSEEYDYGGLHSVASNTGRLTAVVGGIYVISGHATFASDATGLRQLSIRKNGASSPWYDAVSGCIAAYSPIDAASYAASKVNLKNSGTYDATDGVPAYPTWAAGTGWTFVGASSQSLDTNITPALFDHNWSMFVWYSNGGTSGQSPLLSAGNTATQWFDVWSSDFGANRFYGMGDSSGHGTAKSASGWIGMSGAATGNKCWFDGALDTTLAAITTTTATGNSIFIGAEQVNGWYFSGNIKRVWISSTTMTDAQAAALYLAMTDLTYPAIAHQSTTAINGAATRLSVSTTEYLAAGDYVELLASQTSGGALDVDYEDASSPYFTMAMI